MEHRINRLRTSFGEKEKHRYVPVFKEAGSIDISGISDNFRLKLGEFKYSFDYYLNIENLRVCGNFNGYEISCGEISLDNYKSLPSYNDNQNVDFFNSIFTSKLSELRNKLHERSMEFIIKFSHRSIKDKDIPYFDVYKNITISKSIQELIILYDQIMMYEKHDSFVALRCLKIIGVKLKYEYRLKPKEIQEIIPISLNELKNAFYNYRRDNTMKAVLIIRALARSLIRKLMRGLSIVLSLF